MPTSIPRTSKSRRSSSTICAPIAWRFGPSVVTTRSRWPTIGPIGRNESPRRCPTCSSSSPSPGSSRCCVPHSASTNANSIRSRPIGTTSRGGSSDSSARAWAARADWSIRATFCRPSRCASGPFSISPNSCAASRASSVSSRTRCRPRTSPKYAARRSPRCSANWRISNGNSWRPSSAPPPPTTARGRCGRSWRARSPRSSGP